MKGVSRTTCWLLLRPRRIEANRRAPRAARWRRGERGATGVSRAPSRSRNQWRVCGLGAWRSVLSYTTWVDGRLECKRGDAME